MDHQAVKDNLGHLGLLETEEHLVCPDQLGQLEQEVQWGLREKEEILENQAKRVRQDLPD